MRQCAIERCSLANPVQAGVVRRAGIAIVTVVAVLDWVGVAGARLVIARGAYSANDLNSGHAAARAIAGFHAVAGIAVAA